MVDFEEEEDDIAYVMDMEYKWTTVYKVPKQLYDEIIKKYSSLQGLYDAMSGDKSVRMGLSKPYDIASGYLQKIQECPTLKADGFISY